MYQVILFVSLISMTLAVFAGIGVFMVKGVHRGKLILLELISAIIFLCTYYPIIETLATPGLDVVKEKYFQTCLEREGISFANSKACEYGALAKLTEEKDLLVKTALLKHFQQTFHN